jgi:hypothetical protein
VFGLWHFFRLFIELGRYWLRRLLALGFLFPLTCNAGADNLFDA